MPPWHQEATPHVEPSKWELVGENAFFCNLGQVEAGKAGARQEVQKEEMGLLGPCSQGEPRFLSSWTKTGRNERHKSGKSPLPSLPRQALPMDTRAALEQKHLTFDYFLFHFLQLLPHLFQKLLKRTNQEGSWSHTNSDPSLIPILLRFLNIYPCVLVQVCACERKVCAIKSEVCTYTSCR